MKQKDIALIIVVVFISGVLSYVLTGMLITSDKNRKQQVEVINPITADFETPDSKYLNPNALNPTNPIQLGDGANPSPFNVTN